jgi:hypothetical protein
LQGEGLGAARTTAQADASRAIDRVRGRFGATAIGAASALSPAGLQIVRRGQHQWGTDEVDDEAKQSPPRIEDR